MTPLLAPSTLQLLAAVLSVLTAVSSSDPGATTCSLKPPAQPARNLSDLVVYCSADHKKCLDRRTVWFEGKCYTVGTPGPCRHGEIFVINKKILVESQVIVGQCLPINQCDGYIFRERMAHDKCCYETDDIEEKICSPKKNLRLRKNVFGEGECVSSVSDDAFPASRPPLQDGFCYFPDVSFEFEYGPVEYERRFPALRVEHVLNNATVRCSDAERRCFDADAVLFPADGKCYPLLEGGPCPPAHWLVMDKEALYTQGAVSAVCRGPRCLPGQLLMAREQRCRSLHELQVLLCPALDLLLDVFGEAHCGRFTSQRDLVRMPRRVPGTDTCALAKPSNDGSQLAGQAVAVPICGLDDHHNCKTPVSHTPSRPDI